MRFSHYKNQEVSKVFWQEVYKLKLDTQVVVISQDVASGQNTEGFPYNTYSTVNIFYNTATDDY